MDKLVLIDKSCYIFDKEKGIYSKYKKKWCEGFKEHTDYISIKLKCIDGKKRHFQYHRVLCYFFKPIPREYWNIPLEKLQIDHINTITSDNRLDNLRWCTHIVNQNNPITIEHKSAAFINRKDESCPVDKIDPQTGEILTSYPSQKEAARDLGLRQASISRACYGGCFDKRRNKWVNMSKYKGFVWKRR